LPVPTVTPNSAGIATASQSPRPIAASSPTTTEPEPTQSAILGAAARWLAAYHPERLSRSLFVDMDTTRTVQPEVHGYQTTGPRVFGTSLTDATQQALGAALPGLDLTFVLNPSVVVNYSFEPTSMCRPNIGRLLQFGGPVTVASDPRQFYVLVNLDDGCVGHDYVVRVGPFEGGYRVVDVRINENWIA
jgi:hypothetical protein